MQRVRASAGGDRQVAPRSRPQRGDNQTDSPARASEPLCDLPLSTNSSSWTRRDSILIHCRYCTGYSAYLDRYLLVGVRCDCVVTIHIRHLLAVSVTHTRAVVTEPRRSQNPEPPFDNRDIPVRPVLDIPHAQHNREMVIVLRWFRAFRWSYWRRCKGCNARGSKCLCRRPSLAMEQIFFIEERKNKFGARNFSHVSDSAVSGSSGSGSAMTLSTGTSFGEDYRAGDFYRSTQEPTSTAIVRKHSGTMVPVTRSYSQDDVNYSGTYEYDHVRAPPRRQLPPSTTQGEYSIQLYSRKPQQRPARSTSRGSSRMSSVDLLAIRPSSASSVRVSNMSDRMSIDNNTGSYNPRSRLYEGSFAPSIQEDEDDAQARLNGLLMLPSPASSTSTVLERPRYPQYY